jgi:hypothetical protein
MTMIPTQYPNLYTTQLTGPDLAVLLARTGATPAVADPELHDRLGPLPQLPPGRFHDAVIAESAAAGAPETAVIMTAVALLDSAVTASGLLPPALVAVQLPATWIVGTTKQCSAVLSAAEAVAASSRGMVG